MTSFLEMVNRLDNWAMCLFERSPHAWFRKILIVFSVTPKALYPLIFLSAVILDNGRLAVVMLPICLMMDVLIWVLKRIIGRKRPVEKSNNRLLVMSGLGPDGYSFPSAHSFTAFQLIPVSLALLGNWALLSIPYAFLVVISRISLKHHFLSDVVGGALMGIISGILIIYILSAYE